LLTAELLTFGTEERMKTDRIKLLALGMLTLVVVFNTLQAQQETQKFETKLAELPFARIAETHDIDRRCPATGRNDGNVYHYAQNAAKNNFAAKGTPIALTVNDFTRLQQASQKQIDAGRIVLQGKYPEDRTRLQNLITVRGGPVGEGTPVVLQAYVFSSRYANTKFSKDSQGRPERGEAVNCDNPEPDWNDIHLALSASSNANTDECTTVTAEISPHYRPALWSRFHDGLNEEVEAVVPGLLKRSVLDHLQIGSRPLLVRLTGPLFYDASHQPCMFRGGKVIERHSPERRSIWEIHPIYRVQLYDRSSRRWLDLDRWAG
jgi:hypothetical protein